MEATAPVLFTCPTCKRDVEVVSETTARGTVLGLEGTVYVWSFACGHTDRATESAHYYRALALGTRRGSRKRVAK